MFLLQKDHTKKLVSFTQFLSVHLVSYNQCYIGQTQDFLISLNELHADTNRNSIDFLTEKGLVEKN